MMSAELSGSYEEAALGFSSKARATRRILDTSTINRDRTRDQDTRTPKHTGHKAFVDVGEDRFHWQKTNSYTDAFYILPGSLGAVSPVFGSSTRADWEGTYKNKRDGTNPYAGPGNYNCSKFTVLSTNPSAAQVKFGFGSRSAASLTSSPGPCYNIDGVWKNGRDDHRVGVGFNKDHRKPLIIPSTDASYYPKIMQKSGSVIMGTKLKTGSQLDANGGRSPGPIYNTAKYDFRTGPKFSFSKAGR